VSFRQIRKGKVKKGTEKETEKASTLQRGKNRQKRPTLIWVASTHHLRRTIQYCNTAVITAEKVNMIDAVSVPKLTV